jgi:hypothetical protein
VRGRLICGDLSRRALGAMLVKLYEGGEISLNVVKELEPMDTASTAHPRRRVVVLEREDGHFLFAEEYFYISEFEGEIISEGWHRLPPNGLYATADIAEAEGLAAFARWHTWSRESRRC